MQPLALHPLTPHAMPKPEPKNLRETILPTETELKEYGLTLRNGVELQLGKQDPLIKTAHQIAEKYPHHLILIQSGNFLHAYDKSAYFLHKLKNYILKVVGTDVHPSIRCGLPVAGHHRRLWKVCHDFGVPYLVALGTKGNHQLHISNENVTASLLDDIPNDIVAKLIDDLSQTDRLRTTRAVQLLLKPEQVTFRLKQVGNELYQKLHKDLASFPRNHRYFIGRDIADCLTRILQNIYSYALTDQRNQLLRQLSADTDLMKMLIQTLFQKKIINAEKFNIKSALAIELGNLIGGLLTKNPPHPQKST